MLHVDQSFKCDYSSSTQLLIPKIYVAVFVAMEQVDFSHLFRQYAILMPCTYHTNCQTSNKSLNAIQTD